MVKSPISISGPTANRKQLRIAVASSGLGHVARGVESWAADVGMALARRGENVLLFKGAGEANQPYERVIHCWQRDAAKTKRLMEFVPKRMMWRFGLGSTMGIEQWTFTLALLRYLREESIDILHVQEPQATLIVQHARRLGLVNTEVILGHGTNEPPEYLRKVTYLQHLAPYHMEQVTAQGVWKPTWTAIPNFVDTDTFSPGLPGKLRGELGIPAEARIVLSVAAIKRGHKRVDHLIREFTKLRAAAPEIPAWLVVAGAAEPETEGVIAEGKRLLGDRFRPLVSFPRGRIPELYREAEIFVLGSLREMMPIAVLEATASGLPCVINRHPTLQWIAGDGGESVDMEDAGALAAALRRLFGDTDRRQWMGQAGRRHCVQNFGRERVLDQMLDYYRKVLNHAASGAWPIHDGKEEVGASDNFKRAASR